MTIHDFDSNQAIHYENGFYLTSDVTRLAKAMGHFELYKMITGLPGAVVECGVFKATSLVRWATFRELLESPYSRRILGFDIFGAFPRHADETDNAFAARHDDVAGQGLSVAQVQAVLAHKGLRNVELVPGDVVSTIPAYAAAHPELRIALLHIDVDVYKPSQVALDTLYDLVVPSGLLIFDDYGTVAGETRAVDELVARHNLRLQKLSYTHTPSFVVKPGPRP
ncbi:TylF/MycF/NovP-related O-methyltransferase [Hymenobacter sp. PAMC 26628]|uniref:TylF/MycF/NovP-related O-methyltransferase n=1 Tax=Hymenobacter sp. PAMC 26628 TaxID=1484118 RepID=UPI00077021B5|nr:TylF/MycF/NovP-related O-methyltransferase [Hymenobacter sp. PAMC 26628]AMJ65854.1 dTDP-6-deoxy-L-hexose 3-O-methyltransferase [Hymenobacter sp. PAMC 26628]